MDCMFDSSAEKSFIKNLKSFLLKNSGKVYIYWGSFSSAHVEFNIDTHDMSLCQNWKNFLELFLFPLESPLQA